MRYLALNLSLDAFQDGRIAPPPCSFFVSSWNFRAGKKSVPRNAPPRAEWRARARFRQGHNSPLRIIDDGYAETEYSQASWQASRRVINGRDEIIYAALRRQHAGGSGQLRGHLRPTHGQLGMIHDVASIRDPKSDPNSCRWKMRDKEIPLSQSLRRIAEASTFPLFPTTLRVRARLCNSGWMQRSPSLIRLKEARFRRQWSRLRNPSTTNYENFRRACNNCIDFRLASCQPPGMRKWKNQTCVLREGSLKRWQEREDLISESMHDIWASRRGKRLISRRIDEDCNKLTSVPRSARGLRGSEPLNRSRSDLNIIVSALCRQSAGLCYRKRRNSQCGSSSYVGPLSHQPRSHERGCFSARGPVIGRPPRMKARWNRNRVKLALN